MYEPGESALLHALARALTHLVPGNRHGHLPGTPGFPEQTGGFTTPVEAAPPHRGWRVAGRVLNGIVAALEGDYPVTEDPAWERTAADLLRWGHDQVEHTGQPPPAHQPPR